MIIKFINKLLGKKKAAITVKLSKKTTQATATHANKKKTPHSKKTAKGLFTKPVIVPFKKHGINPLLISRHAKHVTETLQHAGYSAYIVGGAVRDLLLGIAPKDFDIATNATPEQVKKLFRRAHLIGRRFQIVHVIYGSEIIEVSTFRALMDNNFANQEVINTTDPTDTDLEKVALDISNEINFTKDIESESEVKEDHFSAEFLSIHPRGKRRRKNPDQRPHAIDASGRVLRDNVWGEQHEDAQRRDFTINAMYYDPATEAVIDYHGGIKDIQALKLRIIGDPAARYREDPVRMLRVVRFAAKLKLEIDLATRAPIAKMADLLNSVPAARLFDEMLKLLLSGHALDCLKRLRSEGLHHGLLPLLDVVLEQPHGEKFVTLALNNTDKRIAEGKSVSPGFLFATLLWQQAQERWETHLKAGQYPIPALHQAMNEVLETQTQKLAIQRRYISDMKEIWLFQPRLEKRSGRSAFRLIEQPKFRAAYDFLLLRCEAGELNLELGKWWTDFIEGNAEIRENLLAQHSQLQSVKRRARRGKNKPVLDNTTAIEDISKIK